MTALPPSVKLNNVEIPWIASDFVYRLRARIGMFDTIEIFADRDDDGSESWCVRLRDTDDKIDAIHFYAPTLEMCADRLVDELRAMADGIAKVLS